MADKSAGAADGPADAVGSAATDDHIDLAARAFGDRVDISARSLLVTVFGDSVVPVGGSIWLGDLIALLTPFGFSERLVRTSVQRLAVEGWFEVERVGRRSRYRLSGFGRTEFAQAERRIYHHDRPAWDGRWTLVFSGMVDATLRSAAALDRHLRWHGFAALSPGVHAAPGLVEADVALLVQGLDPALRVPVATATFEDLGPLLEAGRVADGFGLERAAAGYRAVIEEFGSAHVEAAVEPRRAYLWRTMLVHQLRRAVLHDPWLPGALLPADWPGELSFALAGRLYGLVNDPATAWVEELTGCSVRRGAVPPRFV